MEWRDEILKIKLEGESVIEKIKKEFKGTNILTEKLIESSKLTNVARPLLERIVEAYGSGATLLSNPSEYDICLMLKHDVQFMLKTNKDKFIAKYSYPLDDCIVEGLISIGTSSSSELSIDEENVKKVTKLFLNEYNRILMQIERNIIMRNMEASVIMKNL